MKDAVVYLGGHALTRDAMRAALGRFGLHVVPAVSLQEALDAIANGNGSAPEAVLIDDESLSDEAILEAVTVCAQLRVRVGVISSPRSAALPADAIRIGANAWLSKDMPLPELRYSLERMLAGQLVVDPSVTRLLLGAFAGIENGGSHGPAPRRDVEPLRLTPVERKVLALASEGKANKQIANSLGLSPLTVKNHIARIRARFGAADKAHAVAVALRSGLID